MSLERNQPAPDASQSPSKSAKVCDQCKATFVPRRPHARFCSTKCRREHHRDPVTDVARNVERLWGRLGDAERRLSEVEVRLVQITGRLDALVKAVRLLSKR